MKQKLRVRMPDLVFEVLEKDQKHFGMTKEKLCNMILFNFSFDSIITECKNLLFEEYSYLQFSLNKINCKYYLNLLEQFEIKNESKFIRERFLQYAISHPFIRESNLFKEKINFFKSLIKEKEVLKLYTPDGIVESKVEGMYRDKEKGYTLIKIDSNKVYYLSQIQILGWDY